MDVRYAFREDRRWRSAGQRAQLKSQGVWGSRFRPTRGQSRRSFEHRTASISSTRSLPRRLEPKLRQLSREPMAVHRTDRHLPRFKTRRGLCPKAFVWVLRECFTAWDQLRRHPMFSNRRMKLGPPLLQRRRTPQPQPSSKSREGDARTSECEPETTSPSSATKGLIRRQSRP
ncbi:hypothetical protein VNO77_14422 [Canavalia gladiata]|uniref:Uncharacterized protein n=1 Tax=Canavalia gladiata TaxID=3824 RepID=A0AAN9QQZ0_CANGL